MGDNLTSTFMTSSIVTAILVLLLSFNVPVPTVNDVAVILRAAEITVVHVSTATTTP
jgi:hypothetical protein